MSLEDLLEMPSLLNDPLRVSKRLTGVCFVHTWDGILRTGPQEDPFFPGAELEGVLEGPAMLGTMAGRVRLVQSELCGPCPVPPSVGISQSLQTGGKHNPSCLSSSFEMHWLLSQRCLVTSLHTGVACDSTLSQRDPPHTCPIG